MYQKHDNFWLIKKNVCKIRNATEQKKKKSHGSATL